MPDLPFTHLGKQVLRGDEHIADAATDAMAELLTLPNPRKGWQGGPWAEIALMEIDGGWISAMEVNLSMSGSSSPLYANGRIHASRAAALAPLLDDDDRAELAAFQTECMAVLRAGQ